MFTFEDAIEHALDYIGADPGDVALRDVRRAVLAAIRELVSEHNWTYLFTQGRVWLKASYDTGTVAYDEAQGTWTLAGGVWPSWASDGYIRVADVIYRVAERLTDTTLTTLPGVVAPVGDIPSGTAYKIYQDSYPLPSDFGSMDQAMYQSSWGGMCYLQVSEWLRQNRFLNQEGEPRWFTVTGDQKYPDRLVMRVWPYPGIERSIDFMYRRYPRPTVIAAVSLGTVTLAGGSTSITGTGTQFSPQMVGSVIRISGDRLNLPTSNVGTNPPAFEAVIQSVADPTHVTVKGVTPFAATPAANLTGCRCTVSDPVDIKEEIMLTAFLRGIEKQISISRVMKDRPSARGQYEEQLKKAKGADSPTFMGRVVGQGGAYRQRLARMPYDPNAGGSWVDDSSL